MVNKANRIYIQTTDVIEAEYDTLINYIYSQQEQFQSQNKRILEKNQIISSQANEIKLLQTENNQILQKYDRQQQKLDFADVIESYDISELNQRQDQY
ncbi:MAG: hypothetical protein ACNS62_17010 [Candidatus Cyclobacteriaceae bacterium M3_2C_046]